MVKIVPKQQTDGSLEHGRVATDAEHPLINLPGSGKRFIFHPLPSPDEPGLPHHCFPLDGSMDGLHSHPDG
jgi:hypothetical protein